MFAEALGSIGGLGAAGAIINPVIAASTGQSLFNSYMQWKNYQYQKDIQNEIFSREDNAVQRRVNDLNRAGLSPVLAAGNGAASGAVVSTTAPQTDDIASKYMNLVSMANNIATSETQRRLMDQQKMTSAAQKSLFESNKEKVDTEKTIMEYDYEWWRSGGANGAMPTKNAPSLFTGVGITRNALDEIAKKYFNSNSDLEPGGGRFRGSKSKKSKSSGNW